MSYGYPGKMTRAQRLSEPRSGATANGRTPGRVGAALTDGMTRVPYVDHGTECERPNPPASGCRLPPEVRSRLMLVFFARVNDAHSNFQDALGAERIEALLQREGWGPVAEMASNLLSVGVVGGLVGALVRIQRGAVASLIDEEIITPRWQEVIAAAPVTEEQIRNTVNHIVGGTQANAKARAERVPPQHAARAEFMAIMKGAVSAHSARVREEMPAVLDDDGLLTLFESYAAPFHEFSVYNAAVKNLIARFESSEVPMIGKSWEHDRNELYDSDVTREGRLDVVTFRHRGRSRSALVENPITQRRLTEFAPGSKRPLDGVAIGSVTWVRWLDDDLAPVALDAYRKRVGGEPFLVDVDAGSVPETLAAPVAAWAAAVPWAQW